MTLWKRHSQTCLKANKKEFAKLPPDQHRFFRKCQCACWVTGVHEETKEYIKKSLGVTSWEAGERLKVKLEETKPSTLAAQKLTIEEAFKKWTASKADIGVSEITLDTAYSALLTCIQTFAKDRGITLLSQFDDQAAFDLVESPRWREWKISTRARQLSTLSSFFKYCIGRRWITVNPTDAIERPPTGLGEITAYTPEEHDRLEVAFGNWAETSRTCSGQWALRPTTLHCLKHVLEDTGLRISDALRIRPAIIEELPTGDGECTLRQNKSDKIVGAGDCEVTVYLQRATIEEMKRVPWCSQKYPFMLEPANEGDRLSFKRHLKAQGRTVYSAMQLVGKAAKVADCRPHRFRHTFAMRMLKSEWPLEKVSRFLGHKSVAITQKFYAKWDKSRQKQLRDEVINRWERERAIPQLRKPRAGAPVLQETKAS